MLTKLWEARWFIGQLVEGLTRPQGASPHSRLPHNLKLKHISLFLERFNGKIYIDDSVLVKRQF